MAVDGAKSHVDMENTDINDKVRYNKKCSLCYEIPVQPRLLKECGDSACENCLLTYLKKLEANNELDETFPCPRCGQLQLSPRTVCMTWISELPRPESHESNKKSLCTPCMSTGESKPAVRYCVDCDELICETCMDCHKKFKLTKNHKLVDCDKGDDLRGAQLLSSCLVCSEHSDRKVEVKCDEHNVICCLTCATVNHRSCQAISDVKQLAACCKTRDETGTLKTRLTEVKSCLLEILQINDDMYKEFEASLDEIPIQLCEIKAKLMELYDKIESHVTSQIRNIKSEISASVEQSREEWDSRIRQSAELLAMLDTVCEIGSDSQQYIAAYFANNKLSKLEKILSDQYGQLKGKQLQLNVREKLSKLLKEETHALVNVQSIQIQRELPKTNSYLKQNTNTHGDPSTTSDSFVELEVTSNSATFPLSSLDKLILPVQVPSANIEGSTAFQNVAGTSSRPIMSDIEMTDSDRKTAPQKKRGYYRGDLPLDEEAVAYFLGPDTVEKKAANIPVHPTKEVCELSTQKHKYKARRANAYYNVVKKSTQGASTDLVFPDAGY